jgi:TPR repeat protein
MNRIGIRYEQGLGVTQDEQSAISWYRKAAARGNVDVKWHLQRLGMAER